MGFMPVTAFIAVGFIKRQPNQKLSATTEANEDKPKPEPFASERLTFKFTRRQKRATPAVAGRVECRVGQAHYFDPVH